jgi:diguanylate cyclase (GGDEF)-like protein/PAS domain S-box-containing protein
MARHRADDAGDTVDIGGAVDIVSDGVVSADVVSDEDFGENFGKVLVDLSPDAVFVIVDGFHAFANTRGLQLLGAGTLADLRTKPALDFMHWTVREAAEIRLHTMVDRGQPLEYIEEKVVRLDGAVVDIEAIGRPIKIGDTTGALVVARDITGRRQSEQALREAEEKFRAAFKHAPTGMAILDPEGAFVDANPALARLLNRRPAKLLGATLWDFVDPQDQPMMREDFLRVVEGMEREMSGTFRYRNGAGSDGWMRHSVAALEGTGTYIVHMIDVTAQKVTEADLSRKATHDMLTGLPNRGAVLSKLGAALRSLRSEPGQVHVLFVDLDGFKQVNDKHGHAVGDRVLRAASDRMKGALRPSDTIGRIGGDEFVVIIKLLPHDAPAEEIAHRLAQAVAAPVALDEGIVSVRASIGHASTHDPDLSPARLLGSADADMYRQKQAAQREDEREAEQEIRVHQPGLRVVGN